MITVLHLAERNAADDAIIAWANYRALRLAEQTDPSLQDDPNHVRAVELAYERMQRTYNEWTGQ